MTDSAPAATPDHVDRPHVRPFQPIPVQKDGQQFVALRDPMMLQPQAVVLPLPAIQVVQQFQGTATVAELAEKMGGQEDQFRQLAEVLDKMGMLWGPTFKELETKRMTELTEAGRFPPRASSTLGEDEAACRAQLETWFAETEDPELESRPRGIVAPHLDYARGWPNYAAAWYSLKDGSFKPDRVVILGTNHFGLGDGAVMSPLGFTTPLGEIDPDRDVLDRMTAKFGDALTADQLDHLPEHSIDLQLPWMQYCFGNVPVVAALVPDPLRPMVEDADTKRVAFEPFVEGLKQVLSEVGGTTFFVASSDLSHVGRQFGEPRPVDDRRSMDVERHDREMMGRFIEGDPGEFIGAMRWNRNPTRWCSIGNMSATLMLSEPESIELLDYRQARDEQGMAMVSSASMALM
ncbi:MAG: AmmeMemoRadiSam system protein B [Phycisphaerales bacterium]